MFKNDPVNDLNDMLTGKNKDSKKKDHILQIPDNISFEVESDKDTKEYEKLGIEYNKDLISKATN